MPPEEEAAVEAPAKPARKFPLIPVIVGVNVLVVGVVLLVYFLIVRNGEALGDEGPVDDEPVAAEGPRRGSGGAMCELDPLIVNLNEASGSRYLKVKVVFAVSRGGCCSQIQEKRIVQVKDMLIRFLSGLTYAATQGEAAKREIQEGIQRRMNDLLSRCRVTHIYFTEFVVQ